MIEPVKTAAANVTEGLSRTLQITGIKPESAWEVARAALHSVWITGAGVVLGSLVQSFADGAHSPLAYFDWWRDGHGYGFVIVTLVTPIVRGRLTFVRLQNNAPPATL